MLAQCRNALEAVTYAASRGSFVLIGAQYDRLRELFANGLERISPEQFAIVDDSPEWEGNGLTCNNVLYPVKKLHEVKNYQFAIILGKSYCDAIAWFDRLIVLGEILSIHIFLDPVIVPSPVTAFNYGYRQDAIVPDFHEVLSTNNQAIMAERFGVHLVVASHLIDALVQIKNRQIPGDILNFGVFKGASVRFMQAIMQRIGLTDRVIYGFDTFAGFPEQTRDFDTHDHFAKANALNYADISFEAVEKELSALQQVRLIKGDIGETIDYLDNIQSVALALFDMDDYTPTRIALEKSYPLLSKGGFFVHDHFSLDTSLYCHTCGQRKAMLQFLQGVPPGDFFHLNGTNVFMKN